MYNILHNRVLQEKGVEGLTSEERRVLRYLELKVDRAAKTPVAGSWDLIIETLDRHQRASVIPDWVTPQRDLAIKKILEKDVASGLASETLGLGQRKITSLYDDIMTGELIDYKRLESLPAVTRILYLAVERADKWSVSWEPGTVFGVGLKEIAKTLQSMGFPEGYVTDHGNQLLWAKANG